MLLIRALDRSGTSRVTRRDVEGRKFENENLPELAHRSRVLPFMNPPAVDSAAHVVQLALTPIFLLSGLAALLNVFSTRLGRISDQVDKVAGDPDKSPRQFARLRLRSRALDIAVLLAAFAGALTCGAALTLFLGEIRSGGAGRLLFGLFGGALVCAIAALGAFSLEMILAGQTVRERAEGNNR